MEWIRIALIALLASCATAGSDDGNTPPHDANDFSFPDAGPQPDAGPMPDARIFVDAGPQDPDGGLLCEDSDACGNDECCFSFGGPGFCVPGDEVLGVCIPD